MRTTNLLMVAGLFCGGICGEAAAAHAQGEAPQTINTRLEVRTVGSNLGVTMKEIVAAADSPIWTGYEVASVPGEHGDCCGNYRDSANGQSNGVWHLEKERGNGGGSSRSKNDAKLEGGNKLWILYRADKKHIERIRIMSNQCELDAGGLRLIWLKDVKSEESVRFLSEFVQGRENLGGDENRIGEQALTAIALHADSAADKTLAELSSPGQPEGLRQRASFSMGAARGAAGLVQLREMAKTDPSGDERSQGSFALLVSKEPVTTEEIVRIARVD